METQQSTTDANAQANVTLTATAIAHVKAYIAKHPTGRFLRISIKTAGCNGLQYVYDIVAENKADDYQFQQEGFTFFVARNSMPFIQGAEFDYIESGFQRGWKVTNPQEAGSCGCGESFTI
jgi:iron-sulfur cluster assembly protein